MSQGCRAEGVVRGSLPHILPECSHRGTPVLKGHCRQKGVQGAGLPLPLSPDLSRVGEGASCLRVHLGWGSRLVASPAPR